MPCRQPASDIAENLGRFLLRSATGQRKDFESISTVEMETRNPIECYFGSEFPVICNHCGVMVAWSCKTLKILRTFCVFWKKYPYCKIFKILFRNILSRHRSTCCVQISWNLADEKSVKSCVANLTKTKFHLASSAVATARIAPKIC